MVLLMLMLLDMLLLQLPVQELMCIWHGRPLQLQPKRVSTHLANLRWGWWHCMGCSTRKARRMLLRVGAHLIKEHLHRIIASQSLVVDTAQPRRWGEKALTGAIPPER
jgi:hypothetical protein